MSDYTVIRKAQRGMDEIKPLLEIIEGKGYISGSFAAWMGVAQPKYLPNDIDVFATSDENASYIREKLCEVWQMPFLHVGNVSTHDAKPSLSPIPYSIQVVNPHSSWKDYPKDILDSFDLSLCRAVLVPPNLIRCDVDAGGLLGKFIAINSPMRAVQRMLKYHVRGVTFADSELLKIFKAWDAMTQEQKQVVFSHYARLEEEANSDDDYGGFDDFFFNE